ncbi:PA domain-containing protein [Lysobacter sp. CA199]|uniref:PA domain-containing protein n=1 Tax=Lysobacter sp. CA199 TaxID=3455608 RepID=UPI003F8D3C74
MTKSPRIALLTLSLAVCAGPAAAAQIVLVNVDPANQGLNDPTPAAANGANPGVTIGEQRRIAYQYAADLWGAVLSSEVPIRVQASFTALPCTATAGTLGSAGSANSYVDFPGAAQAATWYPAALADAMAGRNLGVDGSVDIISRFNANLGTPTCLASRRWYYGLDGKTPAGASNFLNVVMHEIAHGLGFASTVDKVTGAMMLGKPDAYSRPVFDNVSGLAWTAMTDAQRKAAIVGGGIVFTGATVTQEAPLYLDPVLSMQAGGALTATYSFETASFGPAATTTGFMGDVVLANDGSANPSLACNFLTNASEVIDRIVVARAGGCRSGNKSLYAQLAGAKGIIIASNQPGAAPHLDDGYSNNAIPTLSLSQADGAQLIGALPGISVSLTPVAGRYLGADTQGRVLLYSPSVLAGGSSLSHYATTLTPDALMEPISTGNEHANVLVDLTPALFTDIGWRLAPGNAMIGICDSSVDAVSPRGIIVGASITARARVCKRDPGLLGVNYINCVNAYSSELKNDGLINGLQQTQIAVCALATAVLP